MKCLQTNGDIIIYYITFVLSRIKYKAIEIICEQYTFQILRKYSIFTCCRQYKLSLIVFFLDTEIVLMLENCQLFLLHHGIKVSLKRSW